jgi:putative Ca2+/H+ antiporter (TMEM165/GDT1 family)
MPRTNVTRKTFLVSVLVFILNCEIGEQTHIFVPSILASNPQKVPILVPKVPFFRTFGTTIGTFPLSLPPKTCAFYVRQQL